MLRMRKFYHRDTSARYNYPLCIATCILMIIIYLTFNFGECDFVKDSAWPNAQCGNASSNELLVIRLMD